MTTRAKIAYRFCSLIFFSTLLLGVLSSGLTAAYVVRPFQSPINLKSSSMLGFANYDKGIPVTVETHSIIPDSSFTIAYQYADSSTAWSSMTSYYGDDVLPHEGDPEVKGGLKKMFYSDTITTFFRDAGHNIDPLVAAAEVSTVTFYAKPTTTRLRLMILLPTLLFSLGIAYCSWQLLVLMSSIYKGQDFRSNLSRRLARIGLAIMLVNMVTGMLIFSGWYQHTMEACFQSNIPNYRTQLTLSGSPDLPFSLLWLAAGGIIYLLCKAFKKGETLQEHDDRTI